MIPEAELVKKQYTLREMRLPSDTKLTRKSLLRWLALSLGLLSEDETRQSILPILDAFFYFQITQKKNPTIKDLAEKSGQPEKAVRYHMSRICTLGLVEEEKRHYVFIRDSSSNQLNLAKAFHEHYSKNLENTLRGIEEAFSELQRNYQKKTLGGLKQKDVLMLFLFICPIFIK